MIALGHLHNLGQSLHLKTLNRITSAMSLLLCRVTDSLSRDEDVHILGSHCSTSHMTLLASPGAFQPQESMNNGCH